MRRYIIECGEGAAGHCGFDVIDEYGRTGLGLAWDEMIGQIVSLTHPQLGRCPQYRMQTPEAWQAEREARALRIEERSIIEEVEESGADLLLRAIVRGVARWLPDPTPGSRKANLEVGMILFAAELDERGRPVIDGFFRAHLEAALERAAA